MQHILAEELAKFLACRLRDTASLPRPRMGPQLSYGRHRGPVPHHARRAAVAVTLYHDPHAGWTLPLTLRPHHLQHHAGQICLPGGQIEAQETARQAAVREFEEELGVTPEILYDCGSLSSQYVYGSGNLVHPVVSIIQRPGKPWSPDPSEVHEVIPMPLSVLNQPEHRIDMIRRRSLRLGSTPDDKFEEVEEVDGLVYRAAAFRYGRHLIWGATAQILDQLARILQTRD